MSGMAILASLGATVASSLSVTASPPSINGSSRSTTFVSPPVRAYVSGGIGPFTYAWSIVDPDGHPAIANSPTSAVTTFTISGVFPGDFASAVATLTVIDTITPATASVDVPVNYTNTL